MKYYPCSEINRKVCSTHLPSILANNCILVEGVQYLDQLKINTVFNKGHGKMDMLLHLGDPFLFPYEPKL